jgi:UDP-glucose 4-epimerase
MSAIVLVTGGAGFIGSHVVDRMAAAGHRVRILDTRPSPWHAPGAVDTVIGDILRPADVQRAVRGCAAVCHLAAAADVSEVHAHPAWATELNGTGTLNVLEAARQAGIARVVYASTVWVYSDVEADRVDEDTLLPNPAHLYTAGKLAGELYCRAYASLYGLEPTVLRFGIPYGPRARAAAVVPSFVSRAQQGKALTIAGDGLQTRQFVYVEDLAEGVVAGLQKGAANRIFNLVGTEETSVRQIADTIRGLVAEVPIVHGPERPVDVRIPTISGARAAAELGWQPHVAFADGVGRYLDWLSETSKAPAWEAAASTEGTAAAVFRQEP